jgi:hypothetical protein
VVAARVRVVRVAGVDTGAPERVDVLARPRDEGNVQPPRRRQVARRLLDAEVVPLVEVIAGMRELVAELSEKQVVEMSACVPVRNTNRDVVEHA